MNLRVLQQNVHISWLIALLCAGIVGGIIVSQYISLAHPVWLWTGIGLGLVAIWRRKVYATLFIVIAGGIIGLWRGSVTQLALTPYSKIIGHQVTTEGIISEDADIGKSGETVLRLKDIRINGHMLPGAMWVSGNTKLDIKRSDIITIKGKLDSGFGNFSASMYRVQFLKVERPEPGDQALKVRDQFSEGVRLAIPEPEASLGVGYLVGQRRALPPELDEALQIAGLMHIVVASGYNLTILVRLARRLFIKISKYLATLFAGGMIVAFVAVTGMSPSMSRAGLVAGLSLAAWYYGRKFHPLVLLPFAAAITLLVNPSYGWNDLGWQLSFAAFSGVMIVAPLTQVYFFGDKKPGTIRQILGETIAAQLVTLPILIVAFGQFYNVAVVANLLILPLVPLAMLLTFIAGLGGLLFPAISSFIGLPASWLLQYMTTVAQYVAGLPWAQTEIAISPGLMYGSYLLMIATCMYMWRKTGFKLRDSSIVE